MALDNRGALRSVGDIVNLDISPMNIPRWRSFVLFLLLGLSGVLRPRAETVPLPVANPSFEALTGNDPRFFDASGQLLLDHYSTFPGVPSLSIGFYSTDAIPGWNGTAPTRPITAGTINYRGSRYFPDGNPDGQNCAFINWVGHISQTLTNTFQAGRTYRLSVDVGVAVGVTFPGYFIGLYAGGQVVAVDTNTVTVPAGGFATATLAFTLPADSSAVGAPIEIRLGIPGDRPDQTVFDDVRLTMTSEAPSPDCTPVPRGLVAW